MIKKIYQQPTMTVVKIQQRSHLMQASAGLTVTSVDSGDTGIIGGTTGSSGDARVKDYSVWSDDWSE